MQVFKEMLIESGYPMDEIAFLTDGFQNGFDIGYRGNTRVKRRASNLKLRVGNEVILWNKIMKEVGKRRFAGPYEDIPFEHYIQSPVGLVPKDNGKDTRLIFHLSYPRGGDYDSVNSGTPKELCSVHYPDFSDAILACLRLGIGCKIAKSDMSSAFRNLGIKRRCWSLLVLMVKSPFDGKIYFFVDKCLPFGASISCSHFQRFSDAVAHLVRFKAKIQIGPINYLDDFLFIAVMVHECDGQMEVFLTICEKINFPVSVEKTFWSTEILTFLGMLINTLDQVISIPTEKVQRVQSLIQGILNKRKVTVEDLQKLTGFLNFLCRCIVPGRAFTRRI